jgi:hypothetical protein
LLIAVSYGLHIPGLDRRGGLDTSQLGGQLLGFSIPEEAFGKRQTGIVDTDPYTGMTISIVQSGADGIILHTAARELKCCN